MLPLWLSTVLAFVASFGASVLALHITERIAVIGSFAGFVLTHNEGIAYGIRIPSPWQEILILIALFFVLLAASKELKSTFVQIAFGMVIGGALGNIADRLAHGTVTDFIQIGSFYIFNVADSCITVGAALLLLSSLVRKKY